MGERSGFDTSSLSTADKIVGGCAFLLFVWSLLPFWYKLDLGPIGSDSRNGFRGITLIAALIALLVVAEVVVRVLGVGFNLGTNRSLIHLSLAGIALVCTALGFFMRPSIIVAKYDASWGLWIAILLGAVWNYGAYMMWNEPEANVPPRPPGGRIG
jgi:hypothetical protein